MRLNISRGRGKLGESWLYAVLNIKENTIIHSIRKYGQHTQEFLVA